MTIDLTGGSLHAYSEAERTAFVRHINHVLGADTELTRLLPICDTDDAIFSAIRDGVLLWYPLRALCNLTKVN
jgi:hypothetical protein